MALQLYRRGTIWHYRGTVSGRRLRGTTETADKELAKRIASEKEASAWRRKLDGPEETFTFAHACEIYLDAGRSVRMVNMVAKHWQDTLVKDIKTPAIHALAWKLFPHTGPESRNSRVITPTQCIVNFSAKQGLCAPLRVERFKVVRREKEPITWDWIVKFCKHAEPRMAGLALFMFLTGARISEALAIEWTHVEGTTVRIRMPKTDGYRTAHLPPLMMAALARIKKQPDDPRIFGYDYANQAKHHWQMTVKRAGIKYLSFHSCRHGFATGLLHSGIDPITIAKLGGWASPQYLYNTYGHAMQDRTVVERLIGTNLTQGASMRDENGKEIAYLGR